MMNEIEFAIDAEGHGAFFIKSGNARIAEMVFKRERDVLIVYHTEVIDALEGQGIGKQLLETMVNYARENQLKVYPLCPYTYAQFKRHPDQYHDIWLVDPKVIRSLGI
jgi:predicted GNAT family acetyltransferase